MTAPAARIAICGAGPVGLALAALLARRGMAPQRIQLIDAKPLDQAMRDPRSIALSWGSRQILERVRAFPANHTPIQEIHVSRRGHFGRTMLSSTDHALPALGYVCRYGDLVNTLAMAVQTAGIVSLRPKRILSLDELPDNVRLHLDDGSSLDAELVVQAEGGIFGQHKHDGRDAVRDYRQCALVALVKSDRAPPGRAFERFTEQGPLALLPQEDGYALVWCLRPESAQQLLEASDQEFLRQLQQAFGNRVGHFHHAGPRFSYPLGLHTQEQAGARSVAIGNAAQILHPVAGQGLNLGLRDAEVLARMLAQSPENADPAALLQAYAKARRADRDLTIRVTDTLARIFANNASGQSMLGLSLGLMDVLPPLKRALARQMMFGRR